MPKVWRFSLHDEARVRQLSGELSVSPLLAQVLIARGFTCGTDAAAFLDAKIVDLHDPELLPGISDAADQVIAAIEANRKITIYGDYDVDGVTATSLLMICLKLAGARVEYYIPDRLEEGYGLGHDALRRLHADDPGQLVITVDCGISCIEEARLAGQLGLALIVTDHHEMDGQLPEAACVVHPRLPGSEYPFGHLCGVGVAFKLAWAVCQRLGDGRKASPRMREFLKSAVGLTAIGTVADVVPLLGENRVLVRYGLGSLAERAPLGVQALMKTAGLTDKRRLAAEDIGYALAPRINAAGRLRQARLAVELLTTNDAGRASLLADHLDQLNKSRKTVERRIFKQAKELVAQIPHWQEEPALVLAHEDWHAGVIGIVANRVAEHFERPAILISLDRQAQVGRGSGRTHAEVDLHAAFSSCADWLQTFGGHKQAAGLKIAADCIDGFRQAFCRFVGDNHEIAGRDSELLVDAEVRLADVTYRAVRELERLGPFGHENPRPLFASSRIELAEPPRKMGEGARHLSLMVRQHRATLRAIAFGRGDWADGIEKASGPLSISFAPMINRFRGRESVELELKDWQTESEK